MNTNTQKRIDEYTALAADLDVRTESVASMKTTLVTYLGYAKSELASDDAVVEAARLERTSLLHRARAVKSSAKRKAA